MIDDGTDDRWIFTTLSPSVLHPNAFQRLCLNFTEYGNPDFFFFLNLDAPQPHAQVCVAVFNYRLQTRSD